MKKHPLPLHKILLLSAILCVIAIVICLTDPIADAPAPAIVTDLSGLFPEYTQVTGAWAMHDLDRWFHAEPEQTEELINLLGRCASFGCEEIHFSEFVYRDMAGEHLFRLELGDRTCDLYITTTLGADRLLFDYGNGDLRAWQIDRLSDSYKAWRALDEKNELDYQLYLLRNAICNGSEPSVFLRDLAGNGDYTYPTKIAAEIARESIRKSIAENDLYTGDEVPEYNLEIIMDNTVYICDDELGVFHIKHKEDTLYHVFPHDHLNYDKYRQDDYHYTPPPAVDTPND